MPKTISDAMSVNNIYKAMQDMNVDQLRSIRDLAGSLIKAEKEKEAAAVKAKLDNGDKVKLPSCPRPKKYANLIGFVVETRRKRATIKFHKDDNLHLPNCGKAFAKCIGSNFELEVPFGMLTILEE